jgi:CRISPR/Cas system-associated exonuclease Cas4 (RecB family)
MAWKSYDKAYVPGQKTAYKLSRSKIDYFMQCQRCFWLDRRMLIKRPDTPPFQINKAIDELFKKEFDRYRAAGEPHPIMLEYGVDAVPFPHKDLDTWRHNFTGVQTIHTPTNLHIFGAVDDVWVNPAGELIVVDYKATAKKTEVSLDADWQIAYKRQMEIYQWLLRQNGFSVSDTGYFVYANGDLDAESFDNTVHFKTKVISYTGSDAWIEPVLHEIKQTLEQEHVPPVGEDYTGDPCAYCAYARSRTELTLRSLQQKNKD